MERGRPLCHSSVMPKKKSSRSIFRGTDVLDYPGEMSQYERESLAAEAKLAEMRKKAKSKRRQKIGDPNQPEFRSVR